MKTVIVIPTYNEAENIQPIITEIFKYLPNANIIVVDDTSSDKTLEIVDCLSKKDSHIKFISRKGKKRNFAQSYIEGFKTAIESGADYIIQMDADFSHNPKHLPAMLEKLKNHDLVIGSRYIDKGGIKNWSAFRKLLSRGGNIYSKFFSSLPINDSTSGFVAWKKNALLNIDLDNIKSNGYSFQIEMKFHAHENDSKIKEIPIEFIDRKSGTSKMDKKIIFEGIFFCLKLFANNLREKKREKKLNNEIVKNYYRFSESYDWTYASDNFVGLETLFHRHRSRIVINLIKKTEVRNGKYLDAACGTGLITRHLPESSIGLDINPRNLEKAKKYAPQINFMEGDIEKINLPNKSFDVVISTEILEHLLDPSKALTEICRILKPKGIFIGSVPSNGLLWKFRFLSNTCGAKEPYHKHYLKSEIKKLLEKNFNKVNIFSDVIRMNWFFVCENPKK